MKRRVHIRGERITDSMNEMRRIKLLMKRDFGLTDENAEKLFDWLQNSGWEEEDVSSVVTQASTVNRPELEAHIIHDSPLIAQVLDNQGVWTGHRDSGAYPNFAIRHRGNAELLFRRLTTGDHLLLRVADRMENKNVNSEYYEITWRNAFIEYLLIVGENPTYFMEQGEDRAYKAACAAIKTSRQLLRSFSEDSTEPYWNVNSKLFCGVIYAVTSSRVGDKFLTLVHFNQASEEQLYKLTMNLIATCYNMAVQLQAVNQNAVVRDIFKTQWLATCRSPQDTFTVYADSSTSESNNGDQTQQSNAGADNGGERGTDGGGDEPDAPPLPTGPEV